MSRHLAWLAGRGVSMSCALDWDVPPGLEAALRERKLSRFEIKARICDENGQVRRFVNIFANDEDIRFLANLDTPVGEKDEVSIVPAIAGG